MRKSQKNKERENQANELANIPSLMMMMMIIITDIIIIYTNNEWIWTLSQNVKLLLNSKYTHIYIRIGVYIIVESESQALR